MIFRPFAGKLGNSFFQRAKGGTIQKKSLDIDWKSNRNPSPAQQNCRKLFSLALKDKKFESKAQVYEAIRKAYEGGI
jgi:hypothetical protein